MKIIYKYPLEVQACTIDLPEGSKVVCVHEQNIVPTIWVEQDLSRDKIEYRFTVIPTGTHFPEVGDHIGTCFIGPNVWHVYLKVKP